MWLYSLLLLVLAVCNVAASEGDEKEKEKSFQIHNRTLQTTMTVSLFCKTTVLGTPSFRIKTSETVLVTMSHCGLIFDQELAKGNVTKFIDMDTEQINSSLVNCKNESDRYLIHITMSSTHPDIREYSVQIAAHRRSFLSLQFIFSFPLFIIVSAILIEMINLLKTDGAPAMLFKELRQSDENDRVHKGLDLVRTPDAMFI